MKQKNIAKPDNWNTLSFSQKIVWRCRHPDPQVDYQVWADKYRVKELLTPVFNVAETYFFASHPLAIDVCKLPGTYVMKATHGWDMSLLVRSGTVFGGNRDLSAAGIKADTAYLQQLYLSWLRSQREADRRLHERQNQYVRPGVLFEQFLDPVDYELQLFLFNGRCRFTMVFYRGFYHGGATHRLYDEHWQPLGPGSEEAVVHYESNAKATIPPPPQLLQKLEMLCHSIDHVRADFYVCHGQYYFSEFTFTHNGGWGAGLIGSNDAKLGSFWLS